MNDYEARNNRQTSEDATLNGIIAAIENSLGQLQVNGNENMKTNLHADIKFKEKLWYFKKKVAAILTGMLTF